MNPETWKNIGKLGIPTVFAAVLLYFVLNVIHAEIHKQTDVTVDSNNLLKLHLEDSSNKLNEIKMNERMMVQLTTAICVNQAKSSMERNACLEAARK